MSLWKIGVMLQNDRGLKKNDIVGVKRNDDLAKWFQSPNFTVFKPKNGEAAFYLREVIPHYVKLKRNATDSEVTKLEEAWADTALKLRKAWKRNDKDV